MKRFKNEKIYFFKDYIIKRQGKLYKCEKCYLKNLCDKPHSIPYRVKYKFLGKCEYDYNYYYEINFK